MFATKDDTFSKSFVEKDNIKDLKRDIKTDTAQVDTIFNNFICGNLELNKAIDMLEAENKIYLEQLNVFSNMDKVFTWEFEHKTLPFIYNDYQTVSFDDIGRNYPTSRIRLKAAKDGDIFELPIDNSVFSVLEDSSQIQTGDLDTQNTITTRDFNTTNTFIKDFWTPAKGKDRYIFTEEAYNKNVAWVNCVCDMERKGAYTGTCWYYCWYWKDVIAAAWDTMRIRQKIDIVENFQQNVLQKTIDQLKGKDNPTQTPPTQAEQTDHKTDTQTTIDPTNKPWESNYKQVVSLCNDFDKHLPKLVNTGYITIKDNNPTFTWDKNKANMRDFAKYFSMIKNVGQGVMFWRHIVLLFRLAPSNNNDLIGKKIATLTKFANDKKHTSNTLDILIGVVGLKKNP